MLTAGAFARKNDANDFTLTAHITAIDMQTGTTGVVGQGSTDYDGKYSSRVGGGGSYTWQLLTVQIDGDNVVYGLHRVPSYHHQTYRLGDYKASWEGSFLRILTTDEKGKPKSEQFSIVSQHASTK